MRMSSKERERDKTYETNWGQILVNNVAIAAHLLYSTRNILSTCTTHILDYGSSKMDTCIHDMQPAGEQVDKHAIQIA